MSIGPSATASVTSRDTGEDLDQIRTAIQALELYAEGIHDDVELAKVHKCIVTLQSILADHAIPDNWQVLAATEDAPVSA